MSWLDCSTLDTCNAWSEWSLLDILIGVGLDFLVLVWLTRGISRAEKLVLAALVFTNGPRLIEVPGSAMDAALAQVLAETHSAVNVP